MRCSSCSSASLHCITDSTTQTSEGGDGGEFLTAAGRGLRNVDIISHSSFVCKWSMRRMTSDAPGAPDTHMARGCQPRTAAARRRPVAEPLRCNRSEVVVAATSCCNQPGHLAPRTELCHKRPVPQRRLTSSWFGHGAKTLAVSLGCARAPGGRLPPGQRSASHRSRARSPRM